MQLPPPLLSAPQLASLTWQEARRNQRAACAEDRVQWTLPSAGISSPCPPTHRHRAFSPLSAVHRPSPGDAGLCSFHPLHPSPPAGTHGRVCGHPWQKTLVLPTACWHTPLLEVPAAGAAAEEGSLEEMRRLGSEKQGRQSSFCSQPGHRKHFSKWPASHLSITLHLCTRTPALQGKYFRG